MKKPIVRLSVAFLFGSVTIAGGTIFSETPRVENTAGPVAETSAQASTQLGTERPNIAGMGTSPSVAPGSLLADPPKTPGDTGADKKSETTMSSLNLTSEGHAKVTVILGSGKGQVMAKNVSEEKDVRFTFTGADGLKCSEKVKVAGKKAVLDTSSSSSDCADFFKKHKGQEAGFAVDDAKGNILAQGSVTIDKEGKISKVTQKSVAESTKVEESNGKVKTEKVIKKEEKKEMTKGSTKLPNSATPYGTNAVVGGIIMAIGAGALFSLYLARRRSSSN